MLRDRILGAIVGMIIAATVIALTMCAISVARLIGGDALASCLLFGAIILYGAVVGWNKVP